MNTVTRIDLISYRTKTYGDEIFQDCIFTNSGFGRPYLYKMTNLKSIERKIKSIVAENNLAELL